MSAGLFFLVIGLVVILYIIIKGFNWILLVISLLVICPSLIVVRFSSKKWNKNQKQLDERLVIENTKIKREVELLSRQQAAYPIIKPETQNDYFKRGKKKTKEVPLVSCQITSVLPNSVVYSFLKDHKAWFSISNASSEKYLAYVKIIYIYDDKEEIATYDDYYSGKKPWKLNALVGIQAPGIIADQQKIDALNNGKRIKVKILCEIHDEKDKFVEKKLPQTYVYDTENNSWFLEP